MNDRIYNLYMKQACTIINLVYLINVNLSFAK